MSASKKEPLHSCLHSLTTSVEVEQFCVGGRGRGGGGVGGRQGKHTRSMVLLLGVVGVPGGGTRLEDCILGRWLWWLQPAPPLIMASGPAEP